LITAIRTEIASLPDFDPVLLQLVEEQQRRRQEVNGQRSQELAARSVAIDREIQNIVAAIRRVGDSPTLLEELRHLDEQTAQVGAKQQELTRVSKDLGQRTLPPMAEIKALAARAFEGLTVTSPEFGRLLRRLIPRLVVYPYRLYDGGHPVLRAHFT